MAQERLQRFKMVFLEILNVPKGTVVTEQVTYIPLYILNDILQYALIVSLFVLVTALLESI